MQSIFFTAALWLGLAVLAAIIAHYLLVFRLSSQNSYPFSSLLPHRWYYALLYCYRGGSCLQSWCR